MEGRGERNNVTVAPEFEQQPKEKFGRIEKVSAELSGKVDPDLEMEGVSPESRLKISAFARQEITGQVEGMDFAQILDKAMESGWKMVIYNAGVAWTGDQWLKNETPDNPLATPKGLVSGVKDKVKAVLSPEEKSEQQNKSASLDFLANGGFDLCLTLDQATEKGFVSSLRADMIAKRFLMQEVDRVGGEKGRGIISSVCWSNGAYKEKEIHNAIFQSVTKKILEDDYSGDDIGVFKSYQEAVQFGQLYGKLEVDVYFGGGPADEEELAVPFKLTSKNQVIRRFSESGMSLANWLIKKLNNLPAKYIPEGERLLATRIQEMGRVTRASEVQTKGSLTLIQDVMRSLLGEKVRILTLADTSGRTVTSDRQHLGDDLRMIYGDKTIMVETHEEKPLPRLSEPREDEFKRRHSHSKHDEIKQYGVLSELMNIVSEIRVGTFNQARNEQKRFVVVQKGAKKYTRWEGTEYRLAPLQELSDTG